MSKIDQGKSYQVETLARTFFNTEGEWFNEPFLKATIINLDSKNLATLDINGPVPLPCLVPITLDCKGAGHNISPIQIKTSSHASDPVVIYWTRYSGFEWNKDI